MKKIPTYGELFKLMETNPKLFYKLMARVCAVEVDHKLIEATRKPERYLQRFKKT